MQTKVSTIQSLFAAYQQGEDLTAQGLVKVSGWVRTNRDSGSIGFIALNDGTCFKNMQVVYHEDLPGHEEISHLLTGAAIYVEGKIVLTPEMKQPFELQASKIEILGQVEPDYPLQKKRHSFEYLRGRR